MIYVRRALWTQQATKELSLSNATSSNSYRSLLPQPAPHPHPDSAFLHPNHLHLHKLPVFVEKLLSIFEFIADKCQKTDEER